MYGTLLFPVSLEVCNVKCYYFLADEEDMDMDDGGHHPSVLQAVRSFMFHVR